MDTKVDMENEDFYKNLLLGAAKDTPSSCSIPTLDSTDGTLIVPQPGFVIKTKDEKDEKIFLNICSTDELPAPKDISEGELTKLIDDVDAMNFRVPIGLGNPHAEIDKNGKGCTVYDILINTRFFEKIQKSDYFMGFFMTVVYEGLEDKYKMSLSRDWVRLKNRKSFGQILPQRIRPKSKPIIQEMDSPCSVDTLREVSKKHISYETKSDLCIPEPSHQIIFEPSVGKVEYLVIEISLPGVKSMLDTTLDVGDDRLILYVQRNKYHLDLKLPHCVDYESGGAQFNRKTKMLTITIPVP